MRAAYDRARLYAHAVAIVASLLSDVLFSRR